MKLNKPMAAITTLAGSNGYIIANWYILSISDKAVFPSLNVIFGATAFVALDLAMVAVVFSEPEKDFLGWFLTVATIATTCAFSGGIAWHLFGDLWHTAFAAAQFMIALHVTHDRKLSHRTRVERVGVEQALQVAVTEREEMEEALQQAVMERDKMGQAFHLAQTERDKMGQALHLAQTERDKVEQAAVSQRHQMEQQTQQAEMSRVELARQLEVAVTERDKLARQVQRAEMSRVQLADQLEERDKLARQAQQERRKLAHQLEVVVTERDSALQQVEQSDKRQAVTVRDVAELRSAESESTQDDLSEEQKLMIQYIAQNPSATYREIADALGVSKSSVSRYREILEARQIISRNGTWKVLSEG